MSSSPFYLGNATLTHAPDPHRLVRWVNQADRLRRRPRNNAPRARAAAVGGGPSTGRTGGCVLLAFSLSACFTIQTSRMGSLRT